MGGCAAVALPPSPQPSPSRERGKTPRRLPLPELAGILSFAAGYATVSSGGGLVQVILVIHGGRLRRRCSSALTPTLSRAGEGEDPAPPPSPGAGGHSFLCRWLCNCLLWGRASPGNPCNPRRAAAPPLLFRPHPNPLPRERGKTPRRLPLPELAGILSFAAGYATVSSGGGLVQVILVIHGGRLRRRCSSALTPTLSRAGEWGRPRAASLSRSWRAFFPLPLVMQLSPLGTG